MYTQHKLRSSFPLIFTVKDQKAILAQLKQILSDPNTYTFGELLELENVNALQNSDDEAKSYYELLNIFTYGTYKDYKNSDKNLPSLTKSQETKLKQLTLVTLASQNKTIPYHVLLEELDIPSIRELEDLIIDSIYQGLCTGKIDQENSEFHVDETFGRDVHPSKLNEFIDKLSAWSNQSEVLIKEIEEKMEWAAKYHENILNERKEYEKKCTDIKKKIDELTKAQ